MILLIRSAVSQFSFNLEEGCICPMSLINILVLVVTNVNRDYSTPLLFCWGASDVHVNINGIFNL